MPYKAEGQTTLLVTNLEKSNLKVPKTVTWDQVKLPERWVLENAIEPVKQEERELEDVIEHPDGDVEIKFSNKRTARLNKRESSSSRYSTSSFPTTNFEKSNIKGTAFSSSGINYPGYKVEIPSTSGSNKNSPTPSDMGWSDFSISMSSLRKLI